MANKPYGSLLIMPVLSNEELKKVELSNAVCFDSIVEKINRELNSDKTNFGKVFAISELVSPEIIWNINIPAFNLVPAEVDGVCASS